MSHSQRNHVLPNLNLQRIDCAVMFMQTSVFICQKIKHLPFIVYVQYYDDREIKRIIISNESEFGLFSLFYFMQMNVQLLLIIRLTFFKKKFSPMKMNEKSGEKDEKNCVSFLFESSKRSLFFRIFFYCFILFLTLILLIRRHHINLLFHTSQPKQIDIEWNRTCKPDYRMRERRKNERILKLALSIGRCRHEIVHICTRYRKACYIER